MCREKNSADLEPVTFLPPENHKWAFVQEVDVDGTDADRMVMYCFSVFILYVVI